MNHRDDRLLKDVENSKQNQYLSENPVAHQPEFTGSSEE